MNQNFYITTAIDYPNGLPHMGHAYEKVVADVYARWYRLVGKNVRFLTGTDENGQKLVKAAQDEGKETGKFVDEKVELFKKLCRDLEISNDDFIRTTEQRHHRTCQEFWNRLEKKGDIYFGEYEGLYCLACETFYPESQAENGNCPVHGTKLGMKSEKGFFFRLGNYSAWARKHIEEAKYIEPESSRREILNRIDKEPIRDLSVSRPNTGWGIPIPGHPDYVMYTWFDALINYMAAVYDAPLYQQFWPADMHVIGKDIIWFHSVIWLSMLKAADFPLPKQVYVHGMVKDLSCDFKRFS